MTEANESAEQAPQSSQPQGAEVKDSAKKSQAEGKDRWVKLGFIAVIVVVAVVVYSLQQQPMRIDGWGTDLDAALQQADREKRPVLVLFVRTPPSEMADRTKTVLTNPQNQQTVIKYKLIKVIVDSDPDSDLASKYKIQQLPTLLLLSPTGMELNRFDGPGHIGEVPFREDFLSILDPT